MRTFVYEEHIVRVISLPSLLPTLSSPHPLLLFILLLLLRLLFSLTLLISYCHLTWVRLPLHHMRRLGVVIRSHLAKQVGDVVGQRVVARVLVVLKQTTETETQ